MNRRFHRTVRIRPSLTSEPIESHYVVLPPEGAP